MPRLNFWRRPDRVEGEERPISREPQPGAAASPLTVPIRDAERRRLTRLLTRHANIEYDIVQSESAFLPENRWTERLEQLDDAIRQANDDIAQLVSQPSDAPAVQLPAEPIMAEVRSLTEPAEIDIQIGAVTLHYRETIDWSERGHQLAQPELERDGGDVLAFVPASLTPTDRQRLTEHLRNSFAIIANDALEQAARDEPLPALTLADLVRPCERCGGWLDPKGRCPACMQLDWQRHQIAVAAERLVDERNDTREELERARERLPIIRRQLQDVEEDIERLRAKGVEPE